MHVPKVGTNEHDDVTLQGPAHWLPTVDGAGRARGCALRLGHEGAAAMARYLLTEHPGTWLHQAQGSVAKRRVASAIAGVTV